MKVKNLKISVSNVYIYLQFNQIIIDNFTNMILKTKNTNLQNVYPNFLK